MRWVKWAFGEAVFRTIAITISKVIGLAATGIPHLVFSTLVIGAVQSAAAGTVVRMRGTPFVPSGRLVFGSMAFGIGAFVNTMLAFTAFLYGAPVGPYTMIVLLSIVPSVFVDRIWFGERLVRRQWTGVALAIIAGWLILGMPNLREAAMLPVWAWLGMANAIGLAVNQGVTRWIKDVDPWVKNFWGGMATAACCLVALLLLGLEAPGIATGAAFQPVLAWSVVLAFVVIGIWSYNVIAYRDGAAIAAKHILVNGSFLSLASLTGFAIFGDELAYVQFAGAIVYLAAFVLVNKKVWASLRRSRGTTCA